MGLVKKAIYLTAAKKAYDWMRNRKHSSHGAPHHVGPDTTPPHSPPAAMDRPQEPRSGEERDFL